MDLIDIAKDLVLCVTHFHPELVAEPYWRDCTLSADFRAEGDVVTFVDPKLTFEPR